MAIMLALEVEDYLDDLGLSFPICKTRIARNHSCVPNAETSFPENNFLLHVTALEDIKSGEEICISYLDCCQRERSRHSRHKILRENYLFVCSCPKCLAEAEDPSVTSEEEEEEEEGEPEDAELEDEMTDV